MFASYKNKRMQENPEFRKDYDERPESFKLAFLFVRDQIQHSWDFKRNPFTCKASEVLTHKTGYCYAKSHLLAALLRARKIPAGFCYQRLRLDDKGTAFCLHGLNAVFLDKIGWDRIDARGNKEGVDAQFTPPDERVALQATTPQERDLPEIWPEPLPIVVAALQHYNTVAELHRNLPDIQVLSHEKG